MAKTETRGRKPNKDKGKEVKVSRPVYLYPSDIEIIQAEHGSLTVPLEKEAARLKKKSITIQKKK